MLQFGTTGFSYFTFSGISTLWHLGGNLTNVTIATPHGISSFNDGPLGLSAAAEQARPDVLCVKRVTHFLSLSLQIRAGVPNRQTSLSLGGSAVDWSVEDSFSVVGRDGHCLAFANGSVSQVNTLSVSGDVLTPQLTVPTVSMCTRVQPCSHFTGSFSPPHRLLEQVLSTLQGTYCCRGKLGLLLEGVWSTSQQGAGSVCWGR